MKEKGFLADTPALVDLGTITCAADAKTEQVTGMRLYDWRYASMQKLASFMGAKPNWKVLVDGKSVDVSDSRIVSKEKLKLLNAKTQPAGLFSILIFWNPETNHLSVADSTVLEKNGIDAKQTLDKVVSRNDKQVKLYFKPGYDGCKQLNSISQVPYGNAD